MRPAYMTVLAEQFSVKDRVRASLFCCCVYIARFVATLYASSGR
jgi:hypothetical protein